MLIRLSPGLCEGEGREIETSTHLRRNAHHILTSLMNQRSIVKISGCRRARLSKILFIVQRARQFHATPKYLINLFVALHQPFEPVYRVSGPFSAHRSIIEPLRGKEKIIKVSLGSGWLVGGESNAWDVNFQGGRARVDLKDSLDSCGFLRLSNSSVSRKSPLSPHLRTHPNDCS